MKAQAAEGDGVLLVEAPYGSGLYCQALALREATLRQPLGLSLKARAASITFPLFGSSSRRSPLFRHTPS